jgi:hypothetical protein
MVFLMIEINFHKSKNFLLFQGTFILINIQLLRNLSVVYVILLALFYGLTFLFYLQSRKTLNKNRLYSYCMFFLLFNIFLIFYSFLNSSIEEVVGAIQRIFFVLPLFFFTTKFISSDNDLSKIIEIYILIITAASLSLLYQYMYGAISWFVDSSTRGGLDRYGSLLGSMPTFGVAGPLALVLFPSTTFKFYTKIFLFYIIVLGIFLTLQKAGIANLGLALLMLLYSFNYKTEILKFKSIFIFISTLIPLILMLGIYFNDYVDLALLLFGISGGPEPIIVDGSYGFIEDFTKRLFGEFMSKVTILDLIFGMGFRGIGGAAGIENGVMSHNGLLDLFLLGGLAYFILFIMIVFNIFNSLILNRKKIDPILLISMKSFYILFFINFPMYTGILINPALCSMFWIFTGYLACNVVRK